jgi:predicted transcriptional regulator
METTTTDIKTAAHELVDHLPVNSTWDDLQYRIYVRQAIEAGIADADAGRVVDVADVRKQFGLQP